MVKGLHFNLVGLLQRNLLWQDFLGASLPQGKKEPIQFKKKKNIQNPYPFPEQLTEHGYPKLCYFMIQVCPTADQRWSLHEFLP